VTMYFDGSAGTYTIGAPPNGYKAAYQACTAWASAWAIPARDDLRPERRGLTPAWLPW